MFINTQLNPAPAPPQTVPSQSVSQAGEVCFLDHESLSLSTQTMSFENDFSKDFITYGFIIINIGESFTQ